MLTCTQIMSESVLRGLTILLKAGALSTFARLDLSLGSTGGTSQENQTGEEGRGTQLRYHIHILLKATTR